MKKRAQAFDGGQFNPGRRLVVKRGDGAAIQAGPLRHIRDAKLVATHENGKVAADHWFGWAENKGCCAA